jgi:hypothetical protein
VTVTKQSAAATTTIAVFSTTFATGRFAANVFTVTACTGRGPLSQGTDTLSKSETKTATGVTVTKQSAAVTTAIAVFNTTIATLLFAANDCDFTAALIVATAATAAKQTGKQTSG